MAGTSTWSQGFETNVQIIDKTQGAVRFRQHEQLHSVIGNITSMQHRNVYGEEYTRQLAEGLESSEKLGTFLDSATLQTTYPSETYLAKQLHQVAQMMATRAERKVERDVFYVSLGGFDTHGNVDETLNIKFKEVNDALKAFVEELKAQNVFDSTVLVAESDFGRSLTSNGAGTDHAWAGNYFLLGGSVHGGRVYNDFPASLLEGNVQDAGRGRLIPKYPWESMMVPVAEWMGADPMLHSNIFPNLGNFNRSTHIIDRSVLFAS